MRRLQVASHFKDVGHSNVLEGLCGMDVDPGFFAATRRSQLYSNGGAAAGELNRMDRARKRRNISSRLVQRLDRDSRLKQVVR